MVTLGANLNHDGNFTDPGETGCATLTLSTAGPASRAR
jgi:hypothetical protein